MTGDHTTEPFDVDDAIDKLNNDDSQKTRVATPIEERDRQDESEITEPKFSSTVEIEQYVEQVWPAPDFRKYQKETVIKVLERLYIDDNDVVTLSAPTGAGKSLYLTQGTLSYLLFCTLSVASS